MATSSQDLVAQLIEHIPADRFRHRIHALEGGGNSSAKDGDLLHQAPAVFRSQPCARKTWSRSTFPLSYMPSNILKSSPAMKIPFARPPQLAARRVRRRPASKSHFAALIPACHSPAPSGVTQSRATRAERLCERVLGDQALWVDYGPGISRASYRRASPMRFTIRTTLPARDRSSAITSSFPGPTKDAILERINFLASSIRAAIGRPAPPSPVRHRVAEAFRRAVDGMTRCRQRTIGGCFSSWRSIDPRSRSCTRVHSPLFWRQPTLRTSWPRKCRCTVPSGRADRRCHSGLAVGRLGLGATRYTFLDALRGTGCEPARSRARHG